MMSHWCLWKFSSSPVDFIIKFCGFVWVCNNGCLLRMMWIDGWLCLITVSRYSSLKNHIFLVQFSLIPLNDKLQNSVFFYSILLGLTRNIVKNIKAFLRTSYTTHAAVSRVSVRVMDYWSCIHGKVFQNKPLMLNTP